MSALCPYHEEIKEGDVALCRVGACALQDNCPYERKIIMDKNDNGTPLLFCQGHDGKFHKPIYFTTAGGYECPACRERDLGEAHGKIQAKLRDLLRGKLDIAQKETKRLKEVVLTNHEEMKRLRVEVSDRKRTLSSVMESVCFWYGKYMQLETELNEVVERHTSG